MVFNGIWQVGHGFQISGIHYTGIGQRAQTSYGGDLRLLGAGGSEAARPRRVAVDVMLEAFNVFNRPNWTITTQESSPSTGSGLRARTARCSLASA